jgi:hypothetical protein
MSLPLVARRQLLQMSRKLNGPNCITVDKDGNTLKASINGKETRATTMIPTHKYFSRDAL